MHRAVDSNSNDVSLLYRRHTYLDRKPTDDRIWKLVLAMEPPRITRPVPIRIALVSDTDAIINLLYQLVLPAQYDGPAISPDDLLRLLGTVRLASGATGPSVFRPAHAPASPKKRLRAKGKHKGSGKRAVRDESPERPVRRPPQPPSADIFELRYRNID